MGDRRIAAIADRLAGPDADAVLRAALEDAGCGLRDAEVRSVHRRGRSSVAVVHRVAVVDERGRDRDRLWVLHASTRPVPDGATQVELDGTTVHCWPFPHDPYLPGLPAAVTVGPTATLLRRLGHDVARPAIHTRSYRPTRRAVVELRPGPDAPPAAYCKLLGGRRAAHVRERTARLAGVHETLAGAGVPVPPVVDVDVDDGLVVLAAVPGDRLRDALRGTGTPGDSGGLPSPAAVLDVVGSLHDVPALPTGADPDGFADVERHVRLLTARLPHRAADLARLAATAGAVGGPLGTVHGDLHDGQVLVREGAVSGLLDVDQAGTGHVAHDLGRLLAGVEASARAAVGEAAARARSWLDTLHRESTERCPAGDVAAATAGAWVGLATGPLRVASTAWEQEAEDRLDRALAWADRTD